MGGFIMKTIKKAIEICSVFCWALVVLLEMICTKGNDVEKP
jgi:hypothetical protein